MCRAAGLWCVSASCNTRPSACSPWNRDNRSISSHWNGIRLNCCRISLAASLKWLETIETRCEDATCSLTRFVIRNSNEFLTVQYTQRHCTGLDAKIRCDFMLFWMLANLVILQSAHTAENTSNKIHNYWYMASQCVVGVILFYSHFIVGFSF